MDIDICKFPAVLRDALNAGNCKFPTQTEIDYEPFEAYRGVKITHKKVQIDRSDFQSQIEKGITDDCTDLGNFSCSVFTDVKELRICLNLPRKNKRIAKGQIRCGNGPCIRDSSCSHVHWFLYESADPSCDFLLIDEDEEISNGEN